MRSVTHQRCFNHAGREAAARCPECAQFYCRECITEHEDRVICAACLKKLAGVPFTQRGAFVGVLRVAQCAAGVFLIWWCFYLFGQSLLAIPDSFHDGTVWKESWLDEP
jgi:hypothetical protein